MSTASIVSSGVFTGRPKIAPEAWWLYTILKEPHSALQPQILVEPRHDILGERRKEHEGVNQLTTSNVGPKPILTFSLSSTHEAPDTGIMGTGTQLVLVEDISRLLYCMITVA